MPWHSVTALSFISSSHATHHICTGRKKLWTLDTVNQSWFKIRTVAVQCFFLKSVQPWIWHRPSAMPNSTCLSALARRDQAFPWWHANPKMFGPCTTCTKCSAASRSMKWSVLFGGVGRTDCYSMPSVKPAQSSSRVICCPALSFLCRIKLQNKYVKTPFA